MLFRPVAPPEALSLSSLLRVLEGPELAGVSARRPVLDVVALERCGVLGRDTGRAAARAESSANGSSSSGGASAVAFAGLTTLEEVVLDGAAGEPEGISSS